MARSVEELRGILKKKKKLVPSTYSDPYTQHTSLTQARASRKLTGPELVQYYKLGGPQKEYQRSEKAAFRDPEYYELDELYNKITKDLDRLESERKVTDDPAENDKRLRVLDATKKYRSSVGQLRDAKQQRLQLDYTIKEGLAAGQEDQAAKLQRKLADVESTSREYMEDFKLLPKLLEQVPTPGSGKKAGPELLQQLSGVLQRTEMRGETTKALNDITNKGELLTRTDIPESRKRDIERNLSERSEILKGIGALTGTGDPHQVFDYDEPKGFWDSNWNPWHHAFEAGRNTLKLLNAVPQGFAGGLKGLAGSIMPEDQMTPAMQEETGHYADKYRGKPVAGQIGGFLEGFARGLDDPWEKGLSYSGFDPWLEQMSKTPVTGFMNNPWFKYPASFALEVSSDPLSFIGGAATKAGKAIDSIGDMASQADLLLKLKAPKYAKKGGKLVGTLKKSLLDNDLITKSYLHAMSDSDVVQFAGDVAMKQPYYKNILAGRRGVGVRKIGGPAREIYDLPEGLRKAEAAIAKPFSTGMDVVKKTGVGEFMVKKFNARPFMTSAESFAADRQLIQRRFVAGEAALRSREGQRVFEGISEPDMAKIFAAADDPLLAAKIPDAHKPGLEWYQTVMKDMDELEAATGIRNLSKEWYGGRLYTLENSKRGLKEKGLEVRHGIGTGEDVIADPTKATAQMWTTKVDNGQLPWLKQLVEEQTGFVPKANSIDDLISEVGQLRKTNDLPFYMKRGHNMEDRAIAKAGGDRVYVTMPVSLPHGETTRVLSGSTAKPALWMTKEQHVKGVPEAFARFPNLITNPYQAGMARMTTGMTNVMGNDLLREVGERFGISEQAFRGMGDRGPQVLRGVSPEGYKTGRLFPEAMRQEYYKTEDIKKMLKGVTAGKQVGWKNMGIVGNAILPDVSPSDITKALKKGNVNDDIIRRLGRNMGIEPRGTVLGDAKQVQRYVPERIGSYLDAQFKPMSQNSTYKMLDKIENVWKGYATALRPGFHVRNSISNMWLLYLGGMNPLDIDAHIKAVKIMRAKDPEELLTIKGITHKVGEWREMSESYGTRGRFMPGTGPDEVAKQQQFATKAEKHAWRLGKLTHPFNEDFLLTEIGRMIGTGIEDEARMVGWISAMKQGDNPITAAKRVNKFLFDYSDITNFEKGVMRRVMPFYTWARKNLSLEVEMMLKQPQKFTHTMAGLEALERAGMEAHGADEMKKQEMFRPDYFKDLFATLTPWSWGKDPLFLNPNLPFQDITNLTDIPKILGGKPGEAENVLFMLNPLLKLIPAIAGGSIGRDVIPEMPQGTAPWFAKTLNTLIPGEDIATEGISEYSGTPEWKVPGWVDYAASQLPLLQDLIQGFRSRSDQPLQQLSRFGGIKTIPFNWQRQAGRQLEESGWEMQDLIRRIEKSQGMEFEPPEDYKMPNLKVPPASVTLHKFMWEHGIPNQPVTKANYEKAKQLFAQLNGPIAPMTWPTLADMQNVTRSKATMTWQGTYAQKLAGWEPEYKTATTPLYEAQDEQFTDGMTFEEWLEMLERTKQ